MLDDDRIIEQENYDLGLAVALEGDRLATAVITEANKLAWPDFVRRYNESVETTRAGAVAAMNAPVVISSLGAFGVRTGAPIVVPPSVATLFVGTAHPELSPNGKKAQERGSRYPFVDVRSPGCERRRARPVSPARSRS